MTRFIAIIACITVLDCLTGMFGFLNGILPGPPAGGVSLGWKILIGITAFGVLVWQAARFAMWVLSLFLRRTGFLGREFGLAAIRGIADIRGRHWAKDVLVRWLWLQVNGRRLKSVTTIAKRARGIEPVKRARKPESVPAPVAANDDRALPGGFVRMRRAG